MTFHLRRVGTCLVSAPARKPRTAARGWLAVLALLATFVGVAASPTAGSTPGPSSPELPGDGGSPIATPSFDLASVPLLAYYYIWYDTSSWTRGKSDQPLLGPYSSDDEATMRQHIEWAEAAGIDGFIVSWKSTAVLDRRLATLVRLARELDFKLAIIYQGLDFARNPVPVSQVADDLDYFISQYGSDPVFDVFGKPLVIWSGTWKFSPIDIDHVTSVRRDRLLILASERSTDGFAPLAGAVDGNAYYWSSVNPDTTPDHETRLAEMGAAVHDAGGLWIAPAAPGFDARLVGGTSVVDREDGKTLQKQLDAAIHSFPDAIGLISWNEFSENSEVEPSVTYGDTSLRVLGALRKTNLSSIGDFDSSSPEGVDQSAGVGRFIAIGIIAALGVAGIAIPARRRRRKGTTR